jgi:hypothetical protein
MAGLTNGAGVIVADLYPVDEAVGMPWTARIASGGMNSHVSNRGVAAGRTLSA